MSALAVSTSVRATPLDGANRSADDFLRAFNAGRAELVRTLYFLLGNHEDAQDAAQDAFLKCWRTRDSLIDVRNLRAWIFRVGLNAAKDLQRSAWRRRSRPLTSDTALGEFVENSPADCLEEKESLEQLRDAL